MPRASRPSAKSAERQMQRYSVSRTSDRARSHISARRSAFRHATVLGRSSENGSPQSPHRRERDVRADTRSDENLVSLWGFESGMTRQLFRFDQRLADRCTCEHQCVPNAEPQGRRRDFEPV
jgi:hypothetical protein